MTASVFPLHPVDLAVPDRFLSGNRSCRQLMVRTRGKVVKGTFRSGILLSQGVCFAVGTAPEITADHERRQLLQAEPVRDSVNFRVGQVARRLHLLQPL